MTKKQMIQLLDDELDAMNKHRSNIERIKKGIFRFCLWVKERR